ncbi:DNA endonuclease SmrA [Mangrovimicrobium sediminis]|uniref:DNA endonuclease SmrA n=1 Tax=Mangrovimicrobium sediminis TaxID=2562682 RepID=A0A4Z0LWK9_9GAMM|nr:DNA endonuclease SmrA [Haliea sp. SAOS-164]TGD71546.1 DNA endonuclease SmrA [Haliea sp. SAOS-164]
MNDDEERLFLDEMSGVVPLKREPRVRRDTRRQADGESAGRRREAAVAGPASDGNPLSDDDRFVEPLDPWYVLDFKRPGVQNGVYRKLRQGRYPADARLDLHRMTVAIARRELYDYIRECHRLGLRSVMVIHGKGESRAQRERCSILKGYVNAWLRELEVVQAFHSAQPQHGGTGAVYILLRKSEAQKQATRDKFSKGRVPYDSGS